MVEFAAGKPHLCRVSASGLTRIAGDAAEARLLGVDGNQGWIYRGSFSPMASRGEWWRVGISKRALQGRPIGSEPIYDLVADPSGGTLYCICFPTSTDVEAPSAWVDTYAGEFLTRRQPIGRLPVGEFYAARTAMLWLVYQDRLRSLSGRIIALPPPVLDGRSAELDSDVHTVADASGTYVYCAVPGRHSIFKVPLADGAIVAARRLAFQPAHVAVDAGAGTIYIAARLGGAVFAIRLF